MAPRLLVHCRSDRLDRLDRTGTPIGCDTGHRRASSVD